MYRAARVRDHGFDERRLRSAISASRLAVFQDDRTWTLRFALDASLSAENRKE